MFIRTEADLFSESPYDMYLSSSAASEYHPISTLTDRAAPIEFFIQGNDTQYLDLNETKLYIKSRILTSAGANIADNVVVAPVNNFLHSMFRQCTVHLNEVMITPSAN